MKLVRASKKRKMFLTSVNSVIFPLSFGIFLGINLTINFEYYEKKFNMKDTNMVQRTWNESLATQLKNEVKILCWIMTAPKNHKTKAFHVKNTWGKRCNKLLFMSSRKDLELNTIPLPVFEGRDNLWDKTKAAFQYVYRNHPEYDFYLKADDDS